jgi:hypothetical protein
VAGNRYEDSLPFVKTSESQKSFVVKWAIEFTSTIAFCS